ncbi:hypothetical protein L3Y34_011385 [Caenorhabditis briggsae]|uniref:Uncharacterized protein n=1 Tax=Caenorhabditis briggsae TaxID=6238 RepID=A0AAE8ZSQ9_CAEBR|nr:hypothetical protein L3Y34_011385 [Caenorhabditis briggsae]
MINDETNKPQKYDNTFARYALPDKDPSPIKPPITTIEHAETTFKEQTSQYENDAEETEEDDGENNSDFSSE